MKSIQNSGFVRFTLLCGIFSSVIYIGTDILAVLSWDGYSFTDQTVSELFAIDAPSRRLVVPAFVLYALLIYLFGYGVWSSSGNKRSLRIAAFLIIGKEVLGLYGTLFAPIHLRGVPGTMSDVMHAIITAAGVFVFMFPAMGFGAGAMNKKFRIYSIITIIVFIIFGILSGLQGKNMANNDPTPWLGIWERINIYGYMVWIIVFSMLLQKANRASIKI